MMRQSPSLSYTDFLRSIDARSPVSSEFRIRTVSGAAMSVLTLLLALHLTYSEYSYNLSTTFLDHVRVVDQSPDGLEVSFDVTFHHIPCALLAADANDPAGQSQSFHIDGGGGRHRVWKNRIDGDGRRMGRKSKFDLGGTLTKEDQVENLRLAKEGLAAAKKKTTTTTTSTIAGEGEGEEAVAVEVVAEGGSDDDEADDEQECGSCYGAGDGGECCNTCDDVKRAYHRKHWHVPDVTAIAQCAHMKRAKDEGGEGCNVHGFVALGTGGGNLHFAPDRQWEKEGDVGSDVFGPGGMVNLNAIMQMFDEGESGGLACVVRRASCLVVQLAYYCARRTHSAFRNALFLRPMSHFLSFFDAISPLSFSPFVRFVVVPPPPFFFLAILFAAHTRTIW